MKNLSSNQIQLIFGIHSVEEALKHTGLYNDDILYINKYTSNTRIRDLGRRAGRAKTQINRVDSRVIDEVVGRKVNHQGILLKRQKSYSIVTLTKDTIINSKEPGVYVLIDRLHDPQNLGSLIRSMVAFNVQGLILSNKHVPPVGEVVWKVSSGALAHLPILWISGVTNFLKTLKKSKDVYIIGADNSGEIITLDWLQDIKILYANIILVLGSEDKGISQAIVPYLDHRVRIEQSMKIDSLNVGVAGGILLYLLYR